MNADYLRQLVTSKFFLFLFALPSCLLFFFESPTDLEDYVSFLSASEVFRQALVSGKILSWTDLFALGTPFPFSPNLTRHPMFLVLSRFDIFTILRAVLVSHFLVGFLSWLRIFQRTKPPASVQVLALCAFYIGLPIQNYLYSDFWPSVGVCYLLLPMLMYLLLICEEARWSPAVYGAAWGGMFLTGHQGYVLLMMFGFTIVSLGFMGIGKRLLRFGSIASIFFFLVASSQIYELLLTYFSFTGNTLKVVQPPRPAEGQILSLLFGPATAFSNNFPDFSRYLFFGPATFLILFRMKKGRANVFSILFFALLVSFFFPLEIILPFIPSRYFLRDVILIVGIMAICFYRGDKSIEKYIVAPQVAYLVCMLAYGVFTLDPFKPLPASVRHMRGESPELNEILALYKKDPGLIAFSDNFYNSSSHFGSKGFGNGRFQIHGMRTLNHLYAKGVSWEAIYPSPFKFYGTLPSHRNFLNEAHTLAFMRVKYIITEPNESTPILDFEEARISQNYRLLRRKISTFETFSFEENPSLNVTSKANCEYPILKCLNFEGLNSHRRKDTEVDWSQNNDEITIVKAIAPSYPIYAILPILFDKGWKSKDPAISLSPFNNSLLLLTISGPVNSQIKLAHTDPLKSGLYVLSSLLCLLASFASVYLLWTPPRSLSESTPAGLPD